MKITLGLALDSRQGPMEKDLAAEALVGPLGLVGLLETHLGLAGPSISPAQRGAEYLGCLKACDDGQRFYSASLQVDDVGTAAELLTWRDHWRLWGWQGTFANIASGRLKDMALVEAATVTRLAPGQAERIDAICERLQVRKTPVTEIQLLDRLDRFPKRLRELLQRFSLAEPVNFTPTHAGRLGEIQRELTRMVLDNVPPNPLTTQPDDSLMVVQAAVVDVAERWLAARCHVQPGNRAILCERGGASLDDALRSSGQPTCGFDDNSAFRPALQVLPLALETLWTPLDVPMLIEFLTHRLGPMPRHAKSVLANALVKQPGLGGSAWKDAKEAIAKLDQGPAVLGEVAFWIESPRWDRQAGVPLSAVIERTDRTLEYFRSKLGSEDPTEILIANTGFAQVADFRTSLAELARQGQAALTARQVARLIEEATSTGARNPMAISEAACWQSATIAAACINPVDEMIWWMPSTPDFPKAHPWSRAEIEILTANGVEIRETRDSVAQLFESWLRPIQAARKRLVMVLPPADQEEHPIWQLLQLADPTIRATSLEKEMHAGRLADFTRAAVHQPLTPIRPQWDLSLPIGAGITRYSFTSLSELFGNPAITVLKRGANLWPMPTIVLEREDQLLGTLAHRLVEELFRDPAALRWDPNQLRTWHQRVFPDLIRREGVTLLAAGAKALYQRFAQSSLRALESLLKHLQEAKAVRVEVEVELTGRLGDVDLVGTLDLIVTLPNNRSAILDFKWGGSKFAATFRDGRFLQLALYAALLKQRDGQWPATVGYFVFSSAELFTLTSTVFPHARMATPDNGETYDDLVAMALSTLTWRLEQLGAGTLAVVDERLGLVGEFQGPAGTLPIAPSNRWISGYLPLFGWRAP